MVTAHVSEISMAAGAFAAGSVTVTLKVMIFSG
jgi:hypothetical protein